MPQSPGCARLCRQRRVDRVWRSAQPPILRSTGLAGATTTTRFSCPDPGRQDLLRHQLHPVPQLHGISVHADGWHLWGNEGRPRELGNVGQLRSPVTLRAGSRFALCAGSRPETSRSPRAPRATSATETGYPFGPLPAKVSRPEFVSPIASPRTFQNPGVRATHRTSLSPLTV